MGYSSITNEKECYKYEMKFHRTPGWLLLTQLQMKKIFVKWFSKNNYQETLAQGCVLIRNLHLNMTKREGY